MILIAVLTALAVAMPAFAVEFKYGGLYRLRYQSNDNLMDGKDKEGGLFDDNANYIDQRLRMYFTFIASERLQVVTKWEADTLWGSAAGGGDIDADSVSLEMKNVYVDFMIPNTPTRATLGVQGLRLLSGWIVDADLSAAVLTTPVDPVKVQLGYIAAYNEDVTDQSQNVDDWFLNVEYAAGPLKAALVGFYQYAHDNNAIPFTPIGQPLSGEESDNSLFDLGLSVSYTADMFGGFLNFVKNFGSYDDEFDDSQDYEGWMVEAEGSVFVQNFTFTLGGFYTSEDFAYPGGVSHYWSEIMGLGDLDVSVQGANKKISDSIAGVHKGDYWAGDNPANLWTVKAGMAWQALATTKLTFNYYYIGTAEEVVSGVDEFGFDEFDDSIGHEFDVYLDQDVVDGLKLRLVGAYLLANDAYTLYNSDDDTYELGARLQWAF